ncbi:MAG: DUF2628 domain-containing protein [Rhodospirillaceae bacterium]|nr:DUF2628 domain-containing protein [Rhodospirillaceae bacterium]
MNVYSIHVRGDARNNENNKNHKPKLVVVKDGFSLGATAFGPLWALVLGLWEAAIIIFIVQLVFGFLINEFIPGSPAQIAAQIGVAITIGISANELRRWNLARRGFGERASVSGTDIIDAERRFFETHPDILRAIEGTT